MNTLATRLGLLGLFLLAGGALVLGEQIDLVYFEENGGGGNPRGLYNFDASTGNSTLRTTVSGAKRYFSFDERPSDGMIFAAEVVTGNALWTIDIDTGGLTFECSHYLDTVADVSFDPATDELYGLMRNAPYGLYTIDPASGGSTFIGYVGNGVRTGMTFAPDGTLYGMTLTGTLYTIDKTTGGTTLIGGSGDYVSTVEDADFTPDGRLFAVDWSGNLVQIDTATGHRTLVGTTGMGTGLTGVLGIPEPAAVLLLVLGAGVLLRRR